MPANHSMRARRLLIALLNKTQRAFAGTFLLVVVALACLANSVIARADPIKHVDGRIRYIVDLFDDDIGKLEKLSDVNSLIVWKKSKADQMIEEVVKLRGVEIIGSTSLVGISFTAYLTEKQLEQFSNDKRVKLITPDFYIRPSAIPWTPSYYYYQQTPWGIRALGGNTASSNGIATVYIVDTGVEMHNELSGLSASNRLTAIATATNGQPVNPTGCYPHATHVAGIIGASSNFEGVVGVLPGVRLVSIAVGDTNYANCGSSPSAPPQGYRAASGSEYASISGFGYGLDMVYQMVLQSQRVGIVNLSFNSSGGEFSANGTLGQKMLQLATPISYPGWFEYPGAFIAQSAGNDYVDACTQAYSVTNAGDGIMVVGALDANGQRVVPMNSPGLPHGFRQKNSDPNFPIPIESSFNQAGSNFGNCVDAWAPGQLVYSTWTGGGYSMLSGTSMAAPHIAGLAARLLETNGGNYNAQTLETAVRAHLSTIASSNLALGQLYLETLTAVPTIEIVEGDNSSMASTINFDKWFNAVTLKFQAIGATSCNGTLTRDGSYYAYLSLSTGSDINVSTLPIGVYAWTITCSNAIFGTSSSATAYGTIRRPVDANWTAKTTSTGNNWQSLVNYAIVSWAYGDPFDQYYTSTNALNCQVQSYGFHGVPSNDPENPASFLNGTANYSQSNPALWDSGANAPPSLAFATFYFQDPHNSPYGIAPYDGYKWKLTCEDGPGNNSVKIMYGKLQ